MNNFNIYDRSAALKQEIENLLLKFTKIISEKNPGFSGSIFHSKKNSEIMKTINKLEIIKAELNEKISELKEILENKSQDFLSLSITDYNYFKKYLDYSETMLRAIGEYLILERNFARGLLYSFLHSKALGNNYKKVSSFLNEAAKLKKALTATTQAANN